MYEVLETGGHERLTKEIFQKIKDEVPTTDDKVKQSPTNDGIYDILLSGSAAGSAEATEGAKKSSTYPLKYSTHGGILSIGDGDTNFGGVSLGWAGSPNVTVERTNQTTGAKNWVEMGLDDIKFNSNSSGTPDTWDGKNTSLKAALAEAAGSGGGGTGGSSVYTCDLLIDQTIKAVGNYNFSKNISEYDAVVIAGDAWRQSSSSDSKSMGITMFIPKEDYLTRYAQDGWGFAFAYQSQRTTFNIDVTNNCLEIGYVDVTSNPAYINKVYGLKFGTLSPIIYSEEEREVGVWIDNKPLYAKSFTLSSQLTVSASSWTNTDLTLSDVEKFINGYAISDDGIFQGSLVVDKNNDVILLQSLRSSASYVKYLTIQYTKTTDVAGSGSYNTLGVPTVHYDTTEQVIGTFLGKTLYQKIIDWSSSPVNIPSTWLATTIDSSNIERVIDCKGHHADGTFYTTDADPTGNNHTKLKMRNNGGGGTYSYVTLQYTKITD